MVPTADSTDDKWVMYATPEWSSANVDASPSQVVAAMVGQFLRALKRADYNPSYSTAWLWVNAYTPFPLPTQPPLRGFLFEDIIGIGAAGGYFSDGSVEGAYLSGRSAAHAVINASEVYSASYSIFLTRKPNLPQRRIARLNENLVAREAYERGRRDEAVRKDAVAKRMREEEIEMKLMSQWVANQRDEILKKAFGAWVSVVGRGIKTPPGYERGFLKRLREERMREDEEDDGHGGDEGVGGAGGDGVDEDSEDPGIARSQEEESVGG